MQKPEGIFKRWYFTKDGKRKQTKVYHMSYVCGVGCFKHPEGGVQHRESTGKKTIDEAKAERAKKLGRIADGKPLLNENEILMGELLQGVNDYAVIHCKKSTQKEYEDKIRVHLTSALGSFRAVDVCLNPSLIRGFIANKKKEGYSESSINGMMSVLSLAFSLAENRISLRPVIKKFSTQNSRKIFFTENEMNLLCKYLPDDVRRPVRLMYLIGWRAWSEIFSRERRHVDWKKGILFLEPGEAKNKEPRIFPLIKGSEVRSILEQQERETRRIEKEKGIRITMLFHREGDPLANYYGNRGYWKPTRYFRNCWNRACKSAGLIGRIRHDCRRSATRSFSSLPDAIAMKLTGHKSHKIFTQYKAIGEKDLFEAVEKLEASRMNHSSITVKNKD